MAAFNKLNLRNHSWVTIKAAGSLVTEVTLASARVRGAEILQATHRLPAPVSFLVFTPIAKGHVACMYFLSGKHTQTFGLKDSRDIEPLSSTVQAHTHTMLPVLQHP